MFSVIDHKYARLLENIPTRHIMREVSDSFDDFRAKAEIIHSTDVSNFFVLGSSNTLNNALKLVGATIDCSSCNPLKSFPRKVAKMR